MAQSTDESTPGQLPADGPEDETEDEEDQMTVIRERPTVDTAAASGKKTVVIHSTVTQATAMPGGGYAKQTWVLHDGVVWFSLKDNNTYHPGGPYWDLAY